MARSEFDDIRAFLADETNKAGDLLSIARMLLDDLEQSRMREAILRTHYLRLLTSARATVAAEAAHAPDPTAFLKHELAEHGQLPQDDETVQRVLADARTAASLLARLEESPQRPRRRAVPLRRCVGTARTLPR
ncbi:hypothetical protein E1267_38140 [Nonomuraea longispora]|uniref:Uncharacterized protein n=1 Tax=Nonomuraea longispora TaxID=1848320 RepID=A0A4R4MX95_9ACTN|nr:hypothetical protein [Nonomuraea longispora]TDB98936.1 hypothetical protein E1267_38140 [Nonomuraea longispora]